MSQSKLGKFLAYSVLILLLTMPLGAVLMADAESTRVFLYPPSQTVGAVGDSFTVNVSISDVSNLYGYELQLYYDSTLMNGTQVTEGSFLKSGGSQTFFYVANFTDHYNSTHGVLYVTSTLTESVAGLSGAGILTTVTFKALALGDSVPLHLADVRLSVPNALPISCLDSDGTVTVIPEFTSIVEVLTLVTASLLGILIGKLATRKPGISFRSAET